MKKYVVLLITILLIPIYVNCFEPHFAKDPAISANGEQVCFVYEGNLWLVPFTGGEAEQLTNSYYSVWGPVFSVDGKKVYFNGNPNGYAAIYSLDLASKEVEEVSNFSYSLIDIAPSGEYLIGEGYGVRKGTSLAKVSLDGTRPTLITEVGGSFASMTADEQSVLYCTRGKVYRERYKGSANGELWKYDIATDTYTKLTNTEITERYPVASIANPGKMYYAKSDGEVFQLFETSDYDVSKEHKLTNFPTWSVRDLSIAKSSDRIVFEKFDELWRYDSVTKKSEKIAINIDQNIVKQHVYREEVENGFGDIEASFDDKILFFEYKFDLFMMPIEGGDVKQITYNHVPIDQIKVLADNKEVVIVKRDNGIGQLYKFSVNDVDNLELISWSKGKAISGISDMANGKFTVFYFEDSKPKMAIINSDFTKFSTIKYADYEVYSYKERPNSHYAAYVDHDTVKDVYYLNIRDLKRNRTYPVISSYKYISLQCWGKDETSLFFNLDGILQRLDLSAIDELSDYESPWEKIIAGDANDSEDKKSKNDDGTDYPKLKFNGEDLGERITALTKVPKWSYIVDLDGEKLYISYSNKADDTDVISTVNYKGEEESKITSISDKSYYSYNSSSKNYYYNNGHYVEYIGLDSQKAGKITNKFHYEYDSYLVKQRVFEEVWGRFGKTFYDPDMHGVDWNEVLHKYEPYLQYCHSADILETIVEEMIGEVNASHTGFTAHREKSPYYYEGSFVGATFDFSSNLRKGIKFDRVFYGTPLRDVYEIAKGDILLAIDDHKIDRKTKVKELFYNKAGKKLKLTIKKAEGKKINIWVEAFDWRKFYSLEYNDWVKTRSKIVKKMSNGKIAYLHIKGMNQRCLQKFYKEFWNDNINSDGFIIDVRGNGGGNISDELYYAITKRPNSITASRYDGAVKKAHPENTYDKPIVILIDEDSFSDAEVFPHFIKSNHVGTLIGMPTSGSVIGTTDATLFDGSTLRQPSHGWYTIDDMNMEGNGAIPDIRVEHTPKDVENDNDRQLQTAVNYLLKK